MIEAEKGLTPIPIHQREQNEDLRRGLADHSEGKEVSGMREGEEQERPLEGVMM